MDIWRRRRLVVWDTVCVIAVAIAALYMAFCDPKNSEMAIGISCVIIMGAYLCRSVNNSVAGDR